MTRPPFSTPSPQQTPALPPQTSLFGPAASPATIPAKKFDFGAKPITAAAGGSPSAPHVPMFLSTAAAGAPASFASPQQQPAQPSAGSGGAGKDADQTHSARAETSQAAASWGADFLQVLLMLIKRLPAGLWLLACWAACSTQNGFKTASQLPWFPSRIMPLSQGMLCCFHITALAVDRRPSSILGCAVLPFLAGAMRHWPLLRGATQHLPRPAQDS